MIDGKVIKHRQTQVLRLIAEGQTTRAIALILGISHKTVEYHRIMLMRNLNIWDIASLTRAAIRNGLIAP